MCSVFDAETFSFSMLITTVACQGIDITGGDAAAQVAGDVLHVLGRLAVDVARQVQVVIVLLDLREADHAGEPGHVGS